MTDNSPAHEPEPSESACIGGDPTCPCQDGDVCHYSDDPETGTKAFPIPARPEPSEAQRAYAAGEWCGECRYSVADDPPCCTVTLAYLAAHPSEAPAEVAAYWRRQGAAEALREAAEYMTAGQVVEAASLRGAFSAWLHARADAVTGATP